MNRIPAPEHGIYILKKNIFNPKADKRWRHDYWKKQEWKEGTKFIIEYYDSDLLPGVEGLRPLNTYKHLIFSKGNQQTLDLILPHLEKQPENTLDEILLAGKEVWGRTPKDVLVYLSQHGFISLSDIKTAIRSK